MSLDFETAFQFFAGSEYGCWCYLDGNSIYTDYFNKLKTTTVFTRPCVQKQKLYLYFSDSQTNHQISSR